MSSGPSLAIPGQLIGSTAQFAPGPGSHITGSGLYASILGPVVTRREASARSGPGGGGSTPGGPQSADASAFSSSLPSLSIARASTSVLPEVDATVLARVTKLTSRQATVEILVVGDTVCREGFQGIIRKEDVRATEKDRVRMAESFRVGDVVRGVVISLGDQSNYYLTTATNHLGCVMATSEAGNQMYPISWKEFKDPKTGVTESRKVAKPF